MCTQSFDSVGIIPAKNTEHHLDQMCTQSFDSVELCQLKIENTIKAKIIITGCRKHNTPLRLVIRIFKDHLIKLQISKQIPYE